ncbi:MAG TPA: VOC family protein [Chitinophagaceae bacterium]|nr:VOC family protein [Chitinophagaceae bacterium]
MSNAEPTYAHGKICYLEIPAENVAASARFYEKVFGWKIRADNTGHTAFDDTVGGVSGMWVTGRKPLSDPGIIISIMVDNAEATLESIRRHGGVITQETGKDFPEITAHFRDPGGNILGIYQHRGS